MKKYVATCLAVILLCAPLGTLSLVRTEFLPPSPEVQIPAFPTLPEETLPPQDPPIFPEPNEPETPDEPSVPEVPNEPSAPEVPNGPSAPEVPDEPIAPEVPNEPQEPLRAQYVYVKSDGLNVRTGAGTEFATLGQVEKGVLLHFEEKSGNWYKTLYQNRTAYISANSAYTSVTLLEKGQEDVENVIEEGLRLLGVPYVYGAVRLHDGNGNFLRGFTVKKFDCSSLMQYIFYHGAGILLNTTTRTQILQGEPVNGKLKRGDLLFFTNASRYYKQGIERVGHVALYLGDNYILHTASDYAKIEQISEKRWGYYLSARRFFE